MCKINTNSSQYDHRVMASNYSYEAPAFFFVDLPNDFRPRPCEVNVTTALYDEAFKFLGALPSELKN